MNELKPCPFCGSVAKAVENKMMGSYPKRWGVICYECDTFQDTRATTQDAAVMAWNSRAAEYALEAENKALREALSAMLHAVCHETGFAAAVRSHTGLAFPWESLDLAEDRARSLLAKGGER